MRIGWHVGLPGPFYLAGTIWHSKRKTWHAKLSNGWRCHHHHRTPEAADECAAKALRRIS